MQGRLRLPLCVFLVGVFVSLDESYLFSSQVWDPMLQLHSEVAEVATTC